MAVQDNSGEQPRFTLAEIVLADSRCFQGDFELLYEKYTGQMPLVRDECKLFSFIQEYGQYPAMLDVAGKMISELLSPKKDHE